MSRRRLIWMLDRGAVLFIGIAVGTVLGLSFATGGKPLAALLGDEARGPDLAPVLTPEAASTSKESSLQALPQGCRGTYPHGPRVDAALAAGRPLQIGVFGDSFGDGVWAATDQAFRREKGVKVWHFSHEGTGFTRYRSRDLLADARDQVAQHPIDLALISIGANDTQGLFVDGHAAPFMSEAWRKVIGERATALVRMLQQRGVTVGWVGLPRMRDADFDRDIQAMNGFFAKTSCDLGVPFANPVRVTEDRAHRFSLRLTDPATGQGYLARANDGKHMTFHGYEVISRPLLAPVLGLLHGGAQSAAPVPAAPVPVPMPAATPSAAPAVHKTKPAIPRPEPSHSEPSEAVPEPKASTSSAPVILPSPTALPTEKSTSLSTAPAKTGPAKEGKGQ